MTQLCKEGYGGRKIAPACGGVIPIDYYTKELDAEPEEVCYINLINL